MSERLGHESAGGGEAFGDVEIARTASTALERMEAALECSAPRRQPPRLVGRQEAFRVRHVVDAAPDGPIRVSNLDPDLVADLRASGLSMEEICTHLGLQP